MGSTTARSDSNHAIQMARASGIGLDIVGEQVGHDRNKAN